MTENKRKLFLLFSHSLTPEQELDARENWGVTEFVVLPDDLQAHFSNVPPDLPDLNNYVMPLQKWLLQHASQEDYVLVQGDLGLGYLLVNFCRSQGFTPIYSTTVRQSVEVTQPDGSIITQRVFRHRMFRRY
jgi:hypothetical protein